MILQICAVKDRAADVYGSIFTVAHIGQAIRQFQDAINNNNPDNTMYKHPDDFDLYHIAQLDDQTGRIIQDDHYPKQIAIGKQLTTKE